MNVLDDCVRLVGIAGAGLLEYGSAYLLEPELEDLGVEKVTMLGCVLECDWTHLKAGVNNLGKNVGSSHIAEIGDSMIGG